MPRTFCVALTSCVVLISAQSFRVDLGQDVDTATAIRSLEAAVASNTKWGAEDKWLQLIKLLHQEGRPKEAESYAVQALQRTKLSPPQLYTLIGDSRIAFADCPGALNAYESAVDDNNEGLEPWIQLTLGYWRCGQPENARGVSDRLLLDTDALNSAHPSDSREAVQHLLGEPEECQGKHCNILEDEDEDELEYVIEVVAFAHSNFAEYAWIHKKYDTANMHSMLAQELDVSWEQWPFYCSKWQKFFGARRTQPTSKSEHEFVDMWQEELHAVANSSGVATGQLVKVVSALREYECSDPFITLELNQLYKPLDFKSAVSSGAAYSPQNYQYGTFFYNGFKMLFEHAKVKPHVTRMVKDNSEFLVLGGNCGNEAFYGALEYGLRTRAIEILCHLSTKAKKIQDELAPDAGIAFECQDCLKSDMSEAMLVYLDNEIWDSFLTTEIYRKMGTELPVGALVIGWQKNVHQINHGWIDRGVVKVEASWTAHMLERVENISRDARTDL